MDEAWTEARLVAMIATKVRELATLDYKRSAALAKSSDCRNELSKDISAFANSGGGTLIYGIAEDANHEPAFLDEGVDAAQISPEWLENITSSSIQRRIDGLKIHRVDLANREPQHVCYVVEVPQSNRAPHMAADRRFYKRYNFKSEPMEEYEVRDVALRGAAPDLRVLVYASDFLLAPRAKKAIDLDILLINNGREPANAACVKLAVDARVVVHEGRRLIPMWTTCGDEPQLLPVHEFTFFWGGPNAFPVFSGAPAKVTSLQFEALDGTNGGPYPFWWWITAPRASEASGAGFIHWHSDASVEYTCITLQELSRLSGVDWCATNSDADTRTGALSAAHHRFWTEAT